MMVARVWLSGGHFHLLLMCTPISLFFIFLLFILCPPFFFFIFVLFLLGLRPHPNTLGAPPDRAVGVEVSAVSAVAEGAYVRWPSCALLPPAGREAHVVPGYRCSQGVWKFPSNAEASSDYVGWAVRVTVLQVGTKWGQATKALLLPAARAAEGEVAGSNRVGDGTAGLAVPFQEERTRTSGAQLLLHHSTPGLQKKRRKWNEMKHN